MQNKQQDQSQIRFDGFSPKVQQSLSRFNCCNQIQKHADSHVGLA